MEKVWLLAITYLLVTSVHHSYGENQGIDAMPAQEEDLEETYIYGSQGNFTEITEDTQKLVDMPGALGDPLGAVFSLPGVVSAGGDFGEPAVRGSSPDDNLFIVDFMPAGYVFHEFNTSIYSENIIQDFQLYSAGFGVEYANVTGAVFDVKLRQPKNQDLSTTLDLSMLRSGVFVESGVGENAAFYLSARKSLIHLFIDEDEEEDGIGIQKAPQDDDYQFKYVWDISDNHALTLSASGASDIAAANFSRESDFVRSNPDFAGDAELDNRFDGQNIVWDYQDDDGHILKLGVGHLKDEETVRWGEDFFEQVVFEQSLVKGRYSFPVTKQHRLTIGGEFNDFNFDYDFDQILFVCTEFDSDCDLSRRGRVSDKRNLDQSETSLYINETWMPNSRLDVHLGLQWQSNDYTDEDFINPRLAISYNFIDSWTFSASAGRYNRFPDIDTVLPQIGNPRLRSPRANHYTLGLKYEIDNGWSIQLETYYKELENLPLALSEDEADGELLYSNDVEGQAYGFDFLVNKDLTEKWYGWFSFSYAKSERTNLRTDKTQDYFLDTPLIANWVMNYQFTENLNVGLRWSVRSGAAYTPIVGVQENPFFEDSVLPVYGEPNSERLPTYDRLDLRMKWDFRLWGYQSALILDIINALNKENITGRSLDYDRVDSEDDPVETEDEVGLGVIPALTFRIKF